MRGVQRRVSALRAACVETLGPVDVEKSAAAGLYPDTAIDPTSPWPYVHRPVLRCAFCSAVYECWYPGTPPAMSRLRWRGDPDAHSCSEKDGVDEGDDERPLERDPVFSFVKHFAWSLGTQASQAPHRHTLFLSAERPALARS